MRWPLAFVVGIVNALVTSAAGVAAADVGTRWHGVSEMEGGRAMLIVFVFLPLSFVVGLIIGVVVARAGSAEGLSGSLKRLGIASVVSLALVAVSLGAAYSSSDHPPTLEGHDLVLEYEVRLPPGFPVHDSLEQNDFRVGLVVSSSDRNFTDVDFARVAKQDSFTVVPGRAHLNSIGMRSISVNHGSYADGKPSQFVDIPLAPRPTRKDFDWSGWLPLDYRMDRTPVPAAERAQVRYRVQFADSTERP